MIKVALICEGISESNMLTSLISKYLGTENVKVTTVQPEISSGKQSGFGGWLQVLNFCNDTKLNENLIFNDFIVIQIDTDACIEKNYDVNPYDENNNRISDEELYAKVTERLKNNLSAEFLQKHSDKIIFAVCINETECWLLPLFYANEPKKRCATTNCVYILNQKLKQQNISPIPDKDKNSTEARHAYQSILKMLKKKKDIMDISKHNYGFKMFVEQLDTINA
jgi:hypothetical protein